MKRFTDIFVALCIATVALSAAMVMRFQLGFGWDAAVVAGTGLMLGLMILQVQTGRLRDRDRLAADVADVVGRLDRLVDDVANVERRLSGVEAAGGRRQRDELDAVLAEVEVIGALVRQVVETVAELESKGREVPVAAPAPQPAPPARTVTPPVVPPPRVEEPPLVPKRFAHLGEAGFLDLVRRSVDANRIDLHLQPIVTLPQRRIRFYEVLTRLRSEDGETIYPADYMPLAEKSGVISALDNQIIIRTVQILRRLTTKTRDVGLFCNISVTSLADPTFFREFNGFLDANRSLADTLVFEFSQARLKSIGPMEYEALRTLQQTGFRFSIDQVTDLRPSFQILAERGFKFAKIAADRILTRMSELGTEIHPADLADFFQRFGIELIVDRVETEAQVVDILDHGVRYGQGFVFSPPRPVRTDVLQAAPEPKVEEPPPAVVKPEPRQRPDLRRMQPIQPEPVRRDPGRPEAPRADPSPAAAAAPAPPRLRAGSIGRAIAQRT